LSENEVIEFLVEFESFVVVLVGEVWVWRDTRYFDGDESRGDWFG
jgi:hypothetical protein